MVKLRSVSSVTVSFFLLNEMPSLSDEVAAAADAEMPENIVDDAPASIESTPSPATMAEVTVGASGGGGVGGACDDVAGVVATARGRGMVFRWCYAI